MLHKKRKKEDPDGTGETFFSVILREILITFYMWSKDLPQNVN